MTHRKPPLIPFRVKLLLGVLAVSGAMLVLMSLLFRDWLRDLYTETITASMAAGAAGLAQGVDPEIVEAVRRAGAGSLSAAELDDVRARLLRHREALLAEFPADWKDDETTARPPDLLLVTPTVSGGAGAEGVGGAGAEQAVGRVLVSTGPAGASAAYAFHEAVKAEERWTRLTYDPAPVRNPRGAKVGGRAPLRLADGTSPGLLVVESDAQLVEDGVVLLTAAVRGVAVVVFAVAGLVAAFVAWSIGRPVRALDAGMARVAAGDYGVRLTPPRSRDEFEVLFERFNAMVAGLSERGRMRDALALASEVQRGLLPNSMPELAGYELAHVVIYCDETGGDSIDCFGVAAEEGAGKHAVFVGDISGHGIAAAMLMSWTRATMRARAEDLGDRPVELLEFINRRFVRDAPQGTFLTCFYAVLDTAAHTLAWASAGHEPALVVGRGGVRKLGATGVPLGAMDDPGFGVSDVVGLAPGDLLFVGTDGLCECRAPGGAFLGRERVERTLVALRDRPIGEIRDALLAMATEHRGTLAQADDLTFVLLRRRG